MEPALFRLGLSPREVDHVLREETVADVQAMVDGSAWRVAWQTTYLMNATGNYKPQVEVDQIRRLFVQDLMAPPPEPEEPPEPEPAVDPERVARARAMLDEALARQSVLDRAKAGGVTVVSEDATTPAVNPETSV